MGMVNRIGIFGVHCTLGSGLWLRIGRLVGPVPAMKILGFRTQFQVRFRLKITALLLSCAFFYFEKPFFGRKIFFYTRICQIGFSAEFLRDLKYVCAAESFYWNKGGNFAQCRISASLWYICLR